MTSEHLETNNLPRVYTASTIFTSLEYKEPVLFALCLEATKYGAKTAARRGTAPRKRAPSLSFITTLSANDDGGRSRITHERSAEKVDKLREWMARTSKADKSHGCRGSIFLKNAIISAHEFDECEFSISMGENVIWYLKAENSQSKLLWMRSVVRETVQNDSDYSSTSTKSHSRNPSISSVHASSSTNPKNDDESTKLFATKLSELEAYRTMCKDQMKSIERLLEQGGVSSIVPQATILSVKATHLALIVNINHIVDLIKTSKVVLPDTPSTPPTSSSSAPPVREPLCATRSVSSSGLRRPSVEQEYISDDNSTMTASTVLARPDIDVTSDCDEFYDADEFDVEARNEETTEKKESDDKGNGNEQATEKDVEEEEVTSSKGPSFRLEGSPVTGHYDNMSVSQEHGLFSTIDKLALEQLKYALAGVEDNVWSLFAEDGPMRMYTRQIEEGGLPVDPLKATHSVDGVTALEFMHYFYDAQYKMQWDHTLEEMSVVEHIAPDSVVLHQKHKTIWPAAPRESLFVSHIRRVDEHKRDGAHDLYIVCNRDVQRQDVPLGSSSAVRVGLTVSMVCETIVKDPHIDRKLTRDDVKCNIIYVSQVHPGGWVPTAALRHVYKKEYPKFLRTFTEFEFHLGTGYIYLANQYDHEVFRKITVAREENEKIGLVIVLQNVTDEEKYSMALDTVRCYAKRFGYGCHVIHAETEKEIAGKCDQKDFMFRRHCVLSLKMRSIPDQWLLFLDGDMGVINPNHLIENFIPKEQETQIVFYDRIMNHEVMAGSYLVRNSHWSRQFLMFWANFERKLPDSFHGSDNGAVHSVILEKGLSELKAEKEFCERTFWQKSKDYSDLATFEVCAQQILKANREKMKEIRILEKGRFAWARDGWLTNSVWSDSDFIFHGWQKKRKDKLIFAMWHSPIVYENPFNMSLCSGDKAHLNWRYKNTFIGSVVDVDRQILSAIQEQKQDYEKRLNVVNKLKKH
ncbi:unnamed protein product [Caenorhabditis sp. 36 PRJEB53466]|nr:unnamed protein product [Caenorhabditis sp. 36 PRJEB53466]